MFDIANGWALTSQGNKIKGPHCKINRLVQLIIQKCKIKLTNHTPIGTELMEETRPADMAKCGSLTVSDETESLLNLLPPELLNQLEGCNDSLSEVAMDLGRLPVAWMDGKRVPIGGPSERLVTQEDIEHVTCQLHDSFGSDNRAGLERQLHRVSRMQNRSGLTIGLTLRVGRHVAGNADMIRDLLLKDEVKLKYRVGLS